MLADGTYSMQGRHCLTLPEWLLLPCTIYDPRECSGNGWGLGRQGPALRAACFQAAHSFKHSEHSFLLAVLLR